MLMLSSFSSLLNTGFIQCLDVIKKKNVTLKIEMIVLLCIKGHHAD